MSINICIHAKTLDEKKSIKFHAKEILEGTFALDILVGDDTFTFFLDKDQLKQFEDIKLTDVVEDSKMSTTPWLKPGACS